MANEYAKSVGESKNGVHTLAQGLISNSFTGATEKGWWRLDFN